MLDVTCVVKGFKLVEMGHVVHEVQHEVVLHGGIESLHLFGGGTAFAHGAVYAVFSFHEVNVLLVYLVNDTGGVNSFFVSFPVNVFLCVCLSLGVVVVQDALELGMGFSCLGVECRSTNSLEPYVS